MYLVDANLVDLSDTLTIDLISALMIALFVALLICLTDTLCKGSEISSYS